MDSTKILLADDHRIILDGLKSLLEDDYEIVAMVEDGQKLVEETLRLQPDVVIVDISMPLMNGIDAVKQIRKSKIDSLVIFLTMHNDALYAKEVLDMGASGFVLKHSAMSELTLAVQEALKGNTYISPAISQELIQLCKNDRTSSDDILGSLSLRQREVLQLIAEGKSAKEAASILNITPRTVEFHKYSVMKQLRIKTSVELVHFAIKYGIVSI